MLDSAAGSQERLLLVDTDIGSDIDDALALLVLMHSPEARVLGVSTVYGNTALRAMIARRLLGLGGIDWPVYGGVGAAMASPMPLWETGLEGCPLLSDAEREACCRDRTRDGDGLGEIAARILEAETPVGIVAIGALTNLAAMLSFCPQIAGRIERVTFMGGGVTYPDSVGELRQGDACYADPSHNIRCDVEAARRVLASGLPVFLVTNDVTTQLWWEGDAVQKLLATEHPAETKAVAALLRTWLAYRSRLFGRPIHGTCVHDPLTVAEALSPGRFVHYVHGELTVFENGSTSFRIDDRGPHRAAVKVDREGFLDWMASRLLPASGGSPAE